MMEMTKIHLVRHGEVHNPEGVLYGRKDGFHLSELGHRMAAKVGEFFEGHDIRAIYASPLERAQETAAPTAASHGLEIIPEPRIIETENKFEGVNVNANRWILAHPKYWSWYINPFEPSWGESYTQIVERFSAAIRDALGKAEGGEAVMVSHQLPIWVMREFVEKRPLAHDPRKRECSLCSVTTLTFVGRQLVAVDYTEPAAELLREARDVTPGTSTAATHTGD